MSEVRHFTQAERGSFVLHPKYAGDHMGEFAIKCDRFVLWLGNTPFVPVTDVIRLIDDAEWAGRYSAGHATCQIEAAALRAELSKALRDKARYRRRIEALRSAGQCEGTQAGEAASSVEDGDTAEHAVRLPADAPKT